MSDLTMYDLEHLTPTGEWVCHATVPMLHPEKYPARLTDSGKVGRVVETVPPRRIWSTEVPTDPSILVPNTDGTPIPWRLPREDDPQACADCGQTHSPPFDASCLI